MTIQNTTATISDILMNTITSIRPWNTQSTTQIAKIATTGVNTLFIIHVNIQVKMKERFVCMVPMNLVLLKLEVSLGHYSFYSLAWPRLLFHVLSAAI